MPTFSRHSLIWKYAAYFAGVVSVLLIVSGAVGGYFAYRESLAALEEVQRAKVHFAAVEIDNYMRAAQDAVRASADKFDPPEETTTQDLKMELIALLRYHIEISELHWISPRGEEFVTVSRFGPNAVGSRHSWSGDPRYLGARRDSNYLGSVYFRSGSEPYVSIAAAGKSGGVLEAEVNLGHVWDVVSQVQRLHDGVAYVVDRSGELISHPDLALVLGMTDMSALPQVARALNAKPNSVAVLAPARDIKGSPVVSTATSIERLGWTVFVEQPLAEAFRPVYASVARSVALVVLGIAAATAASVLLALRMVRPIRQIEARARELADGAFDRRISLGSKDELGTLADQFNRMAGRLQETYAMQETRIAERTHDLALASEAKTRFLAAASHDLRQPIHALALFVGQLRETQSPDVRKTILERIERSVVALEELLESLLDLSKLDVGAVVANPQPLALEELLSRMVAEFAPSVEAKGLALTSVRTSLWVRSDPVLLQRILLNLISNALRYTIRGRILIGCRRRGEEIELIIADSGIGIDPAVLPNVFQEFYRAAPARSDMSAGLGLGLAIVKRLAELLGHRIAIESAPGRGTVVRMRIARAQPQQTASGPMPPATEALQGVRVLIVDDEAPARDAMQGLLTRWGCAVGVAAGGDEAIALALEQRPDAILCDLRLADGETGVDVIDRLERECGAPLPCAFVTGESAPDRLAVARATGHPVVFKPTTPAKLRSLLEHLVSTRERSSDH